MIGNQRLMGVTALLKLLVSLSPRGKKHGIR